MVIETEIIPEHSEEGQAAVNAVPLSHVWLSFTVVVTLLAIIIFLYIKLLNAIIPLIFMIIGCIYLWNQTIKNLRRN